MPSFMFFMITYKGLLSFPFKVFGIFLIDVIFKTYKRISWQSAKKDVKNERPL